MSLTLQEYYNTGDIGGYTVYGNTIRGQSFTPQNNHHLIRLKLKLYREGNPGNFSIGIKATDVDGKPTGAYLANGLIDGNAVTTNTNGVWYDIDLGIGYSLATDTKYAIIGVVSAGDYQNRIRWRADTTSPTYNRGNVLNSTDGGSSWTVDTSVDLMFETYSLDISLQDIYNKINNCMIG